MLLIKPHTVTLEVILDLKPQVTMNKVTRLAKQTYDYTSLRQTSS